MRTGESCSVKTSNVSKLVKAYFLILFMALVPLALPAAAQNTNGANTGRTTAQPNANVNRPTESTPQPTATVNRHAETPRTEPTRTTVVRQEERGIDIPWGLLGLAGLLGLLRRPKRIVERVEVHDTKRVEVHDTNRPNEPRR